MPSWGPEIYEARYTRPRGNTLKVAGVSRYISSAMLWFLADGKSLNVCSCSHLKLIINSFKGAKLAKIRDIIMLFLFATALYMTEEGKEQRERRYVRQAGNWF